MRLIVTFRYLIFFFRRPCIASLTIYLISMALQFYLSELHTQHVGSIMYCIAGCDMQWGNVKIPKMYRDLSHLG